MAIFRQLLKSFETPFRSFYPIHLFYPILSRVYASTKKEIPEQIFNKIRSCLSPQTQF